MCRGARGRRYVVRPLTAKGLTAKIVGPIASFPATVPTVDIDAITFSQEWVRAWNAHDVEAVLRHFDEDVVFTSPVAARLMPETHGVIRGKAALRRYWTLAVERMPDLRFVVDNVYQGVDTIVIAYRNRVGAQVSEVLKFNDNTVVEGHGTYVDAG
jgi:ketosteroid isomerase-like protein